MRIGRVGMLEGGVDIRAEVTPAAKPLPQPLIWRFRMWLLLSAGQWGIAIVRNDGSERPSDR